MARRCYNFSTPSLSAISTIIMIMGCNNELSSIKITLLLYLLDHL
ncbi:hypothetical protein Q7M_1165 (plasmid) [Borrelia crocidurae str. Achema]|uniref:Lipoprotein n=1 Tax=Borrelia crocidurae (strain Achema) TaxID=1155096 RepID=I0FFA7_BORCA|nr:hypothetical protein Q7M_1165 [Borrelia crocidurae str. Achema]